MDADVAIVGFGPTGATLAGLLARRGIKVLLVEKSAEVFPQPRAAHVDHTGLRTVQELGCLDVVLPPMIRNRSLDLVNSARKLLVRVPADQDSVSNLPTSVYFYQPDFDRVLRQTVSAMDGVTVRLAAEMTGIKQAADHVELEVLEDGKTATCRAGWVVGCDGAWSPVREAVGIDLESMDFDERWLVLDLKLTHKHHELPQNRVVQVCDPARPHLTTPISADRQRFEFMLLPGEEPETVTSPEFVASQLAPWIERDGYVVERSAIYTFHGLVAREWRRGRVMIAGDAAHQMPPFLGQGMCSGLRDASNLAWKLAAVVRGGADAAILDTYQAERSPHVRKVTDAAIRFGKLVCMTDTKQARERDRRLLSPEGMGEDGNDFALPRLGRGPLVLEGGGGLFVQPIIEGRRFDDIVGPHFLIVARKRHHLETSLDWWRRTQAAHVHVLEETPQAEMEAWLDRYDANVVVVRPDRYVLGAAGGLDEMTTRIDLLGGAATAQAAPERQRAAAS